MRQTYVGGGLIFTCGTGLFMFGISGTGELLRYLQSPREQYE